MLSLKLTLLKLILAPLLIVFVLILLLTTVGFIFISLFIIPNPPDVSILEYDSNLKLPLTKYLSISYTKTQFTVDSPLMLPPI